MPTIHLDHVSKFYKPKRRRKGPVHQIMGVQGVELTIRQGEFRSEEHTSELQSH